MPIIISEKNKKPQKIKIFIDADLLDEIRRYCTWAKVENEAVFFSQAAEFVLKKDRDWRLYNKKESRS